MGMLGIEPRAVGSKSKHTNNCAMLPAGMFGVFFLPSWMLNLSFKLTTNQVVGDLFIIGKGDSANVTLAVGLTATSRSKFE